MVAANLNLRHTAFAAGSDTLRVGLIGCGGRGSGAANQALGADKNTVLTAMADVFSDPLDRSLNNLRKQFPDRVKVDPDHCFVGLDGYQKVLASGVDVVLLATPPGFRPLHFKATVDAGLGLSLAHAMVTRWGGRIEVESSPGEGSTFTVHLPVWGGQPEGDETALVG
jgi:hypothetical protein